MKDFRPVEEGNTDKTYMRYPEYCMGCELKKTCMRSAQSKARQVKKTDQGVRHEQKSAVQWMIEQFDSQCG